MHPTNDLYNKTTLNPHNQEIRLLHILPGRDDEPLELELSVVALADHPAYAALSYCWGPQDDLQDVKIKGTPFRISRHLQECLLSLRQTDEPLRIWVDAICINQESNREKNTQVPLMKDIYKSAAQVFVWMGKATQGLDLIFNSIRNHAERQIPVKVESIQQVSKELLDTSPEDAEKAFHEFVDLSWFRRTWIIQELALPRSDPIFVCGHHRAQWTDLKRWWLTCRELNGTVTSHGAIMGTKWERLHKILNFPALFNLYQLRELFETDSIFQKGLPLSFLICFTEECLATDPRDKIFGILGIADENAKSNIAIDYDKPVADLYEEASRYLIMKEDRFSVLASQSIVASRASSDPSVHEFHILRFNWGPNVKSSWIRDFGHARGSTLKPEPLAKELNPRGSIYDASFGSPPTLHPNQQKGVLSMIGLKIDVVKEWDMAWRENPRYTSWRVNLAPILKVYFRAGVSATGKRGWSGSIEQEADGDEENSSSEYPWHLSYQPKNGPSKPIREAIWRTLIGDKISASRESVPKSYGAVFQIQLDIGKGKTTSSVTGDDFGSTEEMVKHWNDFQNRLLDIVYRRAAFSTQDGWIGLGPDRVRSGDVVVVLAGSDVPFVLRPVEDGYTLVGECYVEGVMYGEFVKASTDIRPDGSRMVRNGQVFHIR